MRKEQAFFSWLATDRAKAFRTRSPRPGELRPLTDDLLSQVIEQVVAWYDAVEAVLIA